MFMVKGLYLHSTFLLLMPTQSALQYSHFCHSHTFIQCFYFQHFLYHTSFIHYMAQMQCGVQDIARGHFSKLEEGDGAGIFQLSCCVLASGWVVVFKKQKKQCRFLCCLWWFQSHLLLNLLICTFLSSLDSSFPWVNIYFYRSYSQGRYHWTTLPAVSVHSPFHMYATGVHAIPHTLSIDLFWVYLIWYLCYNPQWKHMGFLACSVN